MSFPCTPYPSKPQRVCAPSKTAPVSNNRNIFAEFRHCVIDNAPDDDATANIVHQQFPGVRYVHEAVQGLDVARNRALSEARGDVVAFLDDDAKARDREQQVASGASPCGVIERHRNASIIRDIASICRISPTDCFEVGTSFSILAK